VSDQSTTIGQQAAGQPPVAPVQPQYLTRAEAEAMAKQASDDSFRRAQGLIDKRDKAIQESLKNLQATIAMQKAAGIEITPAQEKQLEDQAILHAVRNTGTSEPAPMLQPAQVANDDALDPITTVAVGFERRYGVEITEADPEFKTINTTGEPDEYLETYLAAIKSKQQRLQTQPQFRTPTNLGQSGGPAPTQRRLKDYRAQLEKGLSGG
jgi:hypothetical protein